MEALELGLGVGDDVLVEQLSQVDAPEQLRQQRGVEGQGGGATLGERGVVGVHERAHVAEQQRGGHRRRRLGLDLDDPQAPILDAGEHVDKGRQVVHVLQTFAERLEDDGELRVFPCHIQQLGTALTLLPQRRTLAGVAPGQ